MATNSDNFLDINDRQSDRHFESLFKQIISSDKWSTPDTQRDIEDSKIDGFCLKTKDLSTNEKIFINFCHSSMMKAPTLDLNEEELRQLLATDATSFTIPLVLTQFKPTLDKSGSKAQVLDVIINTGLYMNKISLSQLYKTFLITVSLETIEGKHKILMDKNDWVLLKNKKYQDICQNNSSISGDKSSANDLNAFLNINDLNGGEDSNNGLDYEYVKTNVNNKLIQYINKNHNNNDVNDGPETVSNNMKPQTEAIFNDRPEDDGEGVDEIQGQPTTTTPKHKLRFDAHSNCLDGRVILPSIYDSNQIDLQIGEDRIVLKASDGYSLDIFVPVLIKCDEVTANYDIHTHILDIQMPLI